MAIGQRDAMEFVLYGEWSEVQSRNIHLSFKQSISSPYPHRRYPKKAHRTCRIIGFQGNWKFNHIAFRNLASYSTTCIPKNCSIAAHHLEEGDQESLGEYAPSSLGGPPSFPQVLAGIPHGGELAPGGNTWCGFGPCPFYRADIQFGKKIEPSNHC